MEYEFRPLGLWADALTPAGDRKPSPFKVLYAQTLSLLLSEAEKLDGGHLVLQVDLPARDIRADGRPRADARYGKHPGVVVSFDSKYGPLRYATDTYTDWKANLRAIALSLEALRAVNRHGVSKTGQQYQGWTAITGGTSTALFTTRDEAETWLRKVADQESIVEWTDWESLRNALRRRFHPDTTKLPADDAADLWQRLDAAAALLGIGQSRG